MQANNNVYIPKTARIIDIKEEALNIKTFTLKFIDPQEQSEFKFRSGQFLEVSVFGIGEVPISISSAPQNQNEFFQLTIQAVGSVTNKLRI
jgi:NAD(P)H-flavin reductase